MARPPRVVHLDELDAIPGVIIDLARVEVRAGNEAHARELLGRALEVQPESVELARQDRRLAALL